jgi:quinoprotein glucose dehydrogenase
MWARSLPVLLGLALGASYASAAGAEDVWSTFNGDLAAQKYSPLTQITPENVGR